MSRVQLGFSFAIVRRAVSAVVVAVVLVACSGSKTASVPHSASAAKKSGYTKAVASQSEPNMFAAAQCNDLTDEAIDSYIDPSVQGADRTLAHSLMRAMPKCLRGDFIEWDQSGHLVSNNPRILKWVTITNGAVTQTSTAPPTTMTKTRSVSTSGVRHAADYTGTCAPPAFTGGAGVRDVSACGMTTGWGFISYPCGTTNFQPGDDGYLYMEITGSGGKTSGSTIEGGFQVNPPDGGGLGDGTIQPYSRATYINSGQYQQMNYSNPGYTFSCGQTLTLTHGMSTGNNGYIYTMVGQLPSNIDPATQYVNMNTQFFYPNNYVWIWSPPGPDMNNNGISGTPTDAAGDITPCAKCSVAKVTAIAQAGGFGADGSYFGVTSGGVFGAINWLELIFGQYSSTCTGQTGSTCQIESSNEPFIYYAGPQFYPDDVVVNSTLGPTTWGPYETWDSIYVGGGDYGDAYQRQPEGGFTEPLPPPPCTIDVDGYCSLQTASYGTADCEDLHVVHGVPEYYEVPYTTHFVYVVYTSTTQVEVATETVTKGNSLCSPVTDSWSPGEPKTQYNDSNLP